MRIARMLSPVHSLGPGERVCLWMQGCSKHCPGCVSPEMQAAAGEDIDEEMLAGIILQTAQRGNCTGLTISGGDPFEQSTALYRLLKLLRGSFRDILVYTGFTRSEIEQGAACPAGLECLGLIDVLIDGRYVDERNTPGCVLRGSENQEIHFLNPALRDTYGEYIKNGRILETFCHNDCTIVTGILTRKDSL